jgi:hypothetical protein
VEVDDLAYGGRAEEGAKCSDGVEQAAAVTDRRNTQLPQVFCRQPAQGFPVDIVGAERG